MQGILIAEKMEDIENLRRGIISVQKNIESYQIRAIYLHKKLYDNYSFNKIFQKQAIVFLNLIVFLFLIFQLY